MTLQSGQPSDDLSQVQKCLQGDAEALSNLRNRMDGALRGILRARGASPTEADDTMADLWGDCVRHADDRPVLLEKYNGKSPLQAWLALVSTNRWYDLKRREKRRSEIVEKKTLDSAPDVPALIPSSPSRAGGDDAMMDLLRDALKAAFADTDAQDLVLLRLVFMHELTQREVARMLGWNETKLSRALNQAMESISAHAIKAVRQRDPWLNLNWQDFLELCRTGQMEFL